MTRGRPYNRAIATGQKLATKLHSAIYRESGGKIGGRMLDSPVLLLLTTGRKTGLERTTPLLYLEDAGRYAVVASNGGAPRHPAWWLNLKANPEAKVEVGGRKTHVRAFEAEGEERTRLWNELLQMYGTYENYQQKTDRRIPVVILEPTA